MGLRRDIARVRLSSASMASSKNREYKAHFICKLATEHDQQTLCLSHCYKDGHEVHGELEF